MAETGSTLFRVSPEDLVGVTEIAQMLKVAVNTAWRLSNRPDFPAPAATLSRGRVWKRRAVEE